MSSSHIAHGHIAKDIPLINNDVCVCCWRGFELWLHKKKNSEEITSDCDCSGIAKGDGVLCGSYRRERGGGGGFVEKEIRPQHGGASAWWGVF